MADGRVPTAKDRREFAGLQGLLATIRRAGPRRGTSLGLGLGSFMSRFVPLRRRVALENLAAAFPERSEREHRDIYRDMCRNLGVVLADFARLPEMGPQDIRDYVRIAGTENFEAARRRESGAIMLTGHFGNWELLSALTVAEGIPVTVLGARQRNPLVEDLFGEYRSGTGVKALSLSQGLKPLVETLRGGGVVGSLADQDGGADGFFTDFLGRPASVQAGLFRLAARMGIPVFTAFNFRDGDSWRAEFQPLIDLSGVDPDRPEDVAREMASEYTRRLEACIRRVPGHWFWVHRRWKTRPPGEATPPAPDGR